MKLKYQRHRGDRINHNFMGFTTFELYLFNLDLKIWQHVDDLGNCNYSSHEDCRTMKAFRRKLKKCPYGVRFMLSSRWKGYNIEGVGTKNI